MKILFVHQGFPAQFRFLSESLVADKANEVVAFCQGEGKAANWHGVKVCFYSPRPHLSESAWQGDLNTKLARAEACFQLACNLKKEGFYPDVIIAHPGWGEAIFLKDVWPAARLGLYCEYFYNRSGYDNGFDPEFPIDDEGKNAQLIKAKNLAILPLLEEASLGISPTHWQAASFPLSFRSKISVLHEGIDTGRFLPRKGASLTLNGHTKVAAGELIVTFAARNHEPCRGIHTFLRSLPALLALNGKVKVFVIGGNQQGYGPLPPNGACWRDYFYSDIHRNLSEADRQRVFFFDYLPLDYYLTLLQSSSVHVYLSYPFVASWSLLEAMSIGCAVIGSNTGPVAEFITDGKNGVLTDFFDSHRLALKIAELLDSEETRLCLGKAARQHIVGTYDRARICLPAQISWVRQLADS